MFQRLHVLLLSLAVVLTVASLSQSQNVITVRGEIVDAATSEPLPARVYIQSSDGRWFFARSVAEAGSAVAYRKQRSEASVEMHTTLSAHPFIAELPPGQYTITAERGKEYLPSAEIVELKDKPVSITVKLQRWIDMARQGWYSGETHAHRDLQELPNAMLADDLNVALPLTYWVTKAGMPPSLGDKNSPPQKAELLRVDPTHVIYPMNTEYEIFAVAEKRHTLGAVFALNHRNVLPRGVPPVRPIAEQIHGEGGLLELDKHNWPWSMMLVPVMKVDLYELANNHLWRTNFHYRAFGEAPAPYMNVESDERGVSEKGWIDFTLQNYYALMNSGFPLRPTAGTASGVHPVPLGFSRVYVHLGAAFSYQAWIQGLDQGHSFVTTGPMLDVKVNGRRPGHSFKNERQRNSYRVTGWARSARPLSKIEILSAGEVVKTLHPANRKEEAGGRLSPIEETIEVVGSTWIAVRCYEPISDNRVRFAHTAPFHIDVAGKPLRPLRAEIEYLIERVRNEMTRNAGILSEAALNEYREALAAYEKIAKTAR